jgi:hypothetical protein
MAFSDAYRESIQDKHIGNVGFTSTTKGITNEGYALKNPHQVLATQIPFEDVVSTYGPLTASGIAAGIAEEHIVKLTADPTVNNNKAWIAYETNCTTSGHSSRGNVRLDQWMRYAETQYKLRLYEDNGSGTAPDYGSEILPSETSFNWEYDGSAGIVYFDDDPSSNGKTTPLWGVFYTYTGKTVSQYIEDIDTTVSGQASEAFKYISDGSNVAEAATSDDTLIFHGTGGVEITVDSVSKTVTVSGATTPLRSVAHMTYNSGSGLWEYAGGFDGVPAALDVYLNGVLNKSNDSEYYTTSVSAGTLQVDFSFNTDDSDWVCITYGHYFQDNQWQVYTSNGAVFPNQKVMIDSTGGAFQLDLPSSPSLGDYIKFFDVADYCGTNNVTVSGSGNKINGVVQNLVIDADSAAFDLIYYNTARGWCTPVIFEY